MAQMSYLGVKLFPCGDSTIFIPYQQKFSRPTFGSNIMVTISVYREPSESEYGNKQKLYFQMITSVVY